MKNEQQQQAKELFIGTGLSKTEIAAKLDVNRRTILLWSRQGNWDKLRRSARTLPSLVAEKCYYLIDNFTSGLLVDGADASAIHLKDAQTIHLLASSIKKLKNRSAPNESMEMFGFFLDSLRRKNPQLAGEIVPEIEQYIEARQNRQSNDFLLDGFNPDGTIPFPVKEIEEHWQDEKDEASLSEEFELFLQTREQKNTPASDINAEANTTQEETYNKKAA